MYSLWEEILIGIAQKFKSDPILFKIFTSDLLLVVEDIDFASYADYNTIYCTGNKIDDVILSLQESSTKLFKYLMTAAGLEPTTT